MREHVAVISGVGLMTLPPPLPSGNVVGGFHTGAHSFKMAAALACSEDAISQYLVERKSYWSSSATGLRRLERHKEKAMHQLS